MNTEQIIELKKAGLNIAEIKELAESGLLKSRQMKGRVPSVNGQPLTDVTLENGVVVKAPTLHLERNDDFITFKSKGYKSRVVSIDDLKAGFEDLEAHRVAKVGKTGVRFVTRKSSALAGKERVLGENLILTAHTAGFI
jgi:hypothetical protein